MNDGPEPGSIPPEMLAYYGRGREAARLSTSLGELEFVRTQEIIRRYLPPPPAVVLDVGGGPGRYARWFAGLGYEVHLVDPVPLHVEQARQAAVLFNMAPASATVGDARRLERADASVDAVLLLGPLYHLTERADRVAALREARRVLRPGGLVAAAAISRFASALDGLWSGYLEDPAFVEIVRRDLADGQHRNPGNVPGYFTTAYFHRPEELAGEMTDAGLHHERTLAVQGPGTLLPDLDAWWKDPVRRERLLETLRWLEAEPTLSGVGGHLLAVAHRADGCGASEVSCR